MEKILSNLLKKSGGLSKISFKEVDEAFSLYCNHLHKWNKSINLISRTGPPFYHHLVDSLQYLKAVPMEGRFLDIGSGAGFPGVPLKILLPKVQMELIESQRKRTDFLRSLVSILKLDEIRVINKRAEYLHKDCNYKCQFDAVLFRGFGKPEVCLKLGEVFLKNNGVLVLKQATHVVYSRKLGLNMNLEKEIFVEGARNAISKIMVFRKVSRETPDIL